MKPRVDVIVPCYNYARYLRACVRTLLDQPGVDVRVLILDDASTDDSSIVASELAQDPRVEFRQHEINRGHIATYNEGIGWAASEYLLLISADDAVTEGSLLRAANLLNANPDVGMVHGGQIKFHTDELPKWTPPATYTTRVQSGGDFIEVACRNGDNPVATPTALVRTALQKALGGYRSDLPHAGDLEMWLRFAARSNIAAINTMQAFKRHHGQNMQLAYVDGAIADLRQRRDAFSAALGRFRDEIAEADALERAALQALAYTAFWTASAAFDAGKTARCRELLEFGLNLDPELPTRVPWTRLRWKQLIGATLWRTVRPVLNSWRASSAPSL